MNDRLCLRSICRSVSTKITGFPSTDIHRVLAMCMEMTSFKVVIYPCKELNGAHVGVSGLYIRASLFYCPMTVGLIRRALYDMISCRWLLGIGGNFVDIASLLNRDVVSIYSSEWFLYGTV